VPTPPLTFLLRRAHQLDDEQADSVRNELGSDHKNSLWNESAGLFPDSVCKRDAAPRDSPPHGGHSRRPIPGIVGIVCQGPRFGPRQRIGLVVTFVCVVADFLIKLVQIWGSRPTRAGPGAVMHVAAYDRFERAMNAAKCVFCTLVASGRTSSVQALDRVFVLCGATAEPVQSFPRGVVLGSPRPSLARRCAASRPPPLKLQRTRRSAGGAKVGRSGGSLATLARASRRTCHL
jgi:hypothetical protein